MACLLLIAATAYRTYTKYSQPTNTFNWDDRGHCDFHNGAYYPASAFCDGVNPYSPEVMDSYPVTCPSRPCPPITFILHLPFTLLDLHVADVVFFAYNIGLMFLLAFLSLRITRGSFHIGWWLLVICLLLISRPGHITLFTGYYTLELVIGTIVALQYGKSRPWLAALGMLIASAKPTFIIPLILLMIAKKDYKATFIGIVICTIAGVGGLVWLAQDSGIGKVVDGIVAGQGAFHADETEFPINTWTRVDLVGMFAKAINWIPADKIYLAGMFVLIALPCIVIRQIIDREGQSGANSLTGVIALVAILLAIYHHSYDCLLIVPVWAGAVFFPENVLPEVGRRSKSLIGILLSVPLFNYASTQSFRDLFKLDQYSFVWQSITMLNGLCLFAVMVIILFAAWRRAVYCTIQKDFGR